jgi:enediyne biosynthesis protein E4
MEDFHHDYPDVLLKNNGDGTFTDVSNESLPNNDKPTKGFAYADYDKDGRLDFVIGNWNSGYRLYHNESKDGNNWISIKLVGSAQINRDAVGAKVYLTTSDETSQFQEVISGSSLGAGNDLTLHFGLGQATIQTLEIVWSNGEKQGLEKVEVNQFVTVTFGQ